MSTKLDYEVDPQDVINSLAAQVGTLSKEVAVLSAVITSLESTIVELRSSTHSHDEQGNQ